MQPLISVIVPSYNKAEFIEDAIKSVFSQDYPNKEFFIFDNCSTDGSREIFQRYPSLCVSYELDKGQSDALNKGFKLASGEIVAWLNADDYFLPGVFAMVAQHMSTHPEIDVLYSDYYWVNREGNFIKELRLLDFNLSMSLYCGMNIPGTLCFFRKRVFEEGFYLNIHFRYLMDMEFITRLGKAGKKIVHLPGVYFGCFRMYGTNLATRYRRMEGKELEEEWKKHLQEHYRFRELYGPLKASSSVGRLFYWIMKKYWRVRMVTAKALRGLYYSRVKYYFRKPETRISALYRS